MRHIPALLAALLLASTIRAADTLHAVPFARELGEARAVLALEDGTVLVSRPQTFDVIALRDRDGDGRADDVRTAVSSIEGAHGLAMHGRTLYVAGTRRIVAAERLPDGSFSAPREVVSDLPDGGGQPLRTLSAGPDGKLYVSIAEHGTLLQIGSDGGNRRVLARGLREVRGLAWHPETGELWAADGGELNRIGDGLNFESEAPAARQAAAWPAFTGEALHGIAKNAVVRMRFEAGKPAEAETVAELDDVKPAGFAVAGDGTMFLSDERGVVYRLAATPAAMTSHDGEPAAMSILARVFGLGGLPGAASVIHDEEQDVYFVSGTGFVARVSPDGRIVDPRFIDGVKSPKGWPSTASTSGSPTGRACRCSTA